jgi:hypothetical protein
LGNSSVLTNATGSLVQSFSHQLKTPRGHILALHIE